MFGFFFPLRKPEDEVFFCGVNYQEEDYMVPDEEVCEKGIFLFTCSEGLFLFFFFRDNFKNKLAARQALFQSDCVECCTGAVHRWICQTGTFSDCWKRISGCWSGSRWSSSTCPCQTLKTETLLISSTTSRG